jgi:hypothetical protein
MMMTKMLTTRESFEKQWKEANNLPKNQDFGTTDDLRAGRFDEIDIAFWADYIDELERLTPKGE